MGHSVPHLRRALHRERLQHLWRDKLADLVVPVAHQRRRAHDERRRRLLACPPLLLHGRCCSAALVSLCAQD